MGNGSRKVGLMSEPPKKHGYFSIIKIKSNKIRTFDEEFCKKKKHLNGSNSDRSNISKNRNHHSNKSEETFRTRFDPRITARYEIKALIGRGSFSHVVRVEHRYTHQPFAIKLLEVEKYKSGNTCHVELGILRRVHHANIIRLMEVFETPRRVYLVLELATGGELLDRVVSRGFFTERDATKALIMVSRGLSYIHALGVIHRDLKPENLLYYHPGQDSRLIITDFGLACWNQKMKIQMVEFDDVVTEGSSVPGTGKNNASCAQSDRKDDDSCDIVQRKAKGAKDNCRLVDDGKARDESSQRAISGDGGEDTNWVGTVDEREIDKSLGFYRMEKGSYRVMDEMTSIQSPTVLEGTKRTQNACLEESKTARSEVFKYSHDTLREKIHNNSDERSNIKKYTNNNSDYKKSHNWALRTLCGTPEFLAPEMVAGSTYSCEVDMWALGVISYIILSGSMPFELRSRPRLFAAILRGSYSFHGQPWSSISNQAKDFIERLLCVNPEQRMSAEQALKHPWLHNMASCSTNINLHRPISQNLRQRASRASNYTSSSRSVSESQSIVSSRSKSHTDSKQLAKNRSQHSVAVSA